MSVLAIPPRTANARARLRMPHRRHARWNYHGDTPYASTTSGNNTAFAPQLAHVSHFCPSVSRCLSRKRPADLNLPRFPCTTQHPRVGLRCVETQTFMLGTRKMWRSPRAARRVTRHSAVRASRRAARVQAWPPRRCACSARNRSACFGQLNPARRAMQERSPLAFSKALIRLDKSSSGHRSRCPPGESAWPSRPPRTSHVVQ